MRTSVYVHFPWCLKKCPYCDFASGAIQRAEVPHRAYAERVVRELSLRGETLHGRSLESVFFGGGTPSLWDPDALGEVLRAIAEHFDADLPSVEVTVECNPTSLDAEHATRLREQGVNRLSVGVQSLNNDRLRFLGRMHDADGALRSLRAALKVMPRLSADLMFGMPDQTPSHFLEEVDVLLDLGLRHLSAYALTVEPQTQFGALHRKGRLTLAPEEHFAETFEQTHQHLVDRGFSHYEVSNYATGGEASTHNQHYWRGGDYLGLGAGAVGALAYDRAARRYRNEPAPQTYLDAQGLAEASAETLSPEDRVREALMLGLRTQEGVSLEQVQASTGVDLRRGREAALARRLERGDLVLSAGSLRVPHDRWLLLDGIVVDLF